MKLAPLVPMIALVICAILFGLSYYDVFPMANKYLLASLFVAVSASFAFWTNSCPAECPSNVQSNYPSKGLSSPTIQKSYHSLNPNKTQLPQGNMEPADGTEKIPNKLEEQNPQLPEEKNGKDYMSQLGNLRNGKIGYLNQDHEHQGLIWRIIEKKNHHFNISKTYPINYDRIMEGAGSGWKWFTTTNIIALVVGGTLAIGSSILGTYYLKPELFRG